MTTAGQVLRLRRFNYEARRTGLIVPIDHGLTLGPLPGLSSLTEISRWIRHSGITGIIAHKGMVERLSAAGLLGKAAVIVHLNGMNATAAEADRKELLTSVETAARLGADGVSLQINFNGHADMHNLPLLGKLVERAQRYGLPVLTMVYDKVAAASAAESLARQRHLMRVAIELGSDALKIAPPVQLTDVATLLAGVTDHTAVYFAGGNLTDSEQIQALARSVVAAGGAGLCVGRNIFQSDRPKVILDQLTSILSADPLSARPLLKNASATSYINGEAALQ